MRIFFIVISIATMSLATAAAQAPRISLQQAVEKGLANRSALKSGQLQVQLAAREDAKLKARWQPQVSAGADLRVNTQLQKSVIPIGAFGLPNTPSDATATVAFGVPFQNIVGIDVSQKIYDAGRAVDRQLNALHKNAREIDLAKLQRDIRLAVTEAYYDLVFQEEKTRYTGQSLERARAGLEYGEMRLRSGVALPNEVERLRLDFSNAQLAQRNAIQDLTMAARYLRYQIGDPDTSALLPADTETLQTLLGAGTLPAAQKRPEISLEENAQQQNALQARKESLRNKPVVSAYGNYSILALNETINPFNYFGVRANMTLYDGKQARLAAEDYRLRQEINAANLETLQADIQYEISAARKSLQQGLAALAATEKNVALARQIYQTDQYRFTQGALLLNDLKASELSLQTAEYNYLNAVYTALKAHLLCLKALGG